MSRVCSTAELIAHLSTSVPTAASISHPLLVRIVTREQEETICAVSAASVVLENVVAFEVARAFREKFGGDSLAEVRAQHAAFMKLARSLPASPPEQTLA